MSLSRGLAVCLECVFAEGIIAEGGQCCLAHGALIVSAEGLGCALCVPLVRALRECIDFGFCVQYWHVVFAL